MRNFSVSLKYRLRRKKDRESFQSFLIPTGFGKSWVKPSGAQRLPPGSDTQLMLLLTPMGRFKLELLGTADSLKKSESSKALSSHLPSPPASYQTLSVGSYGYVKWIQTDVQNIPSGVPSDILLLLLSSVKEDEENEFLLPLNHHAYAYVYPLTHTHTHSNSTSSCYAHVSFLLGGHVGRISGCVDAVKGSLHPSQPR